MAIIGKVEKKSLKVKILNISIHVLLLLGAVTMVYPLLLMVSGSFKSEVDFSEFSLLPEFIYNHELLFQKHLATKFNGQNNLFFNAFREPVGSVNNVRKPENPSRVRFDDYKAFLAEMKERKPHYWRGIGMANETGVYPMVLRDFRIWLSKKYGKGEEGIKKLNEACDTDYTSWDAVGLPVERFHTRKISTDYSKGILKEILEFKNTQISGLHTYWVDLDGFFVDSLRKNVARDLTDLNRELKTKYNSWLDIALPRSYPKGKGEFTKLLESLRKSGYMRIEVDGERYDDGAENVELDKNIKHTISVVVDRLVIKEGIVRRLTDSLEAALKLSEGLVECVNGEERTTYSTKYSCPDCDISMEELTPRFFSFNSPYGACPKCFGLGFGMVPDLNKFVKWDKSLAEGAVDIKGWSFDTCKVNAAMMRALAKKYDFSLNVPFKELPEKIQKIVLYGDNKPLDADMRGVFNNAVDLYKKGDLAESKEAFIRAMKMSPDDFDLHAKAFYNIGNIDYRQAKYSLASAESAAESGAKAAQLDRAFADTAVAGNVLLQQGAPLLEIFRSGSRRAKCSVNPPTITRVRLRLRANLRTPRRIWNL